MPRVYAFTNQKGGVGKTTTVVNVAACISEWGWRTLVVDIDPQSNATTSLGIDPRSLSVSVYDVLVGAQAAPDIVRNTRWRDLDLLPASPSLAGASVELNQLPVRERAERLREALSTVQDYDYILIDSPPSLGVLTVSALAAAQGVLVPVQCEYLALEGLSQLMHTVALVRRSLNPDLELRGVIVTMYDRRTTLSRQVADELRAHFAPRVFDTIVPRSVRLSEAPSYGEPGVFYAPHSTGAIAYRLVTRELLLGDGLVPAWAPPADPGSE